MALALEVAWLQAKQNWAQVQARWLTECVLPLRVLNGWWNRALVKPSF